MIKEKKRQMLCQSGFAVILAGKPWRIWTTKSTKEVKKNDHEGHEEHEEYEEGKRRRAKGERRVLPRRKGKRMTTKDTKFTYLW